MERSDILTTLTSIFRDIFADPTLEISDATTAADIDRWDSLSNVNLVITIEKTFSIRFALGELKTLENVGAMISLLEQKLNS